MIQDATDRRNDQERRILLKTQDQQLVHRAVHGAGLSPWEAEVIFGFRRRITLPGDSYRWIPSSSELGQPSTR